MPSKERVPVCAIIGTKGWGPKWSDEVADMAFYAGAAAVEAGYHVLTGGLSGVMSHAARGAKAAGGVSIGVLPGSCIKDANDHIDIVIATGIGFARNMITPLSADIVLALPGRLGTLQEMAYALDNKKPVLSWDSWTLDGVSVAAREDRDAVEAWLRSRPETEDQNG